MPLSHTSTPVSVCGAAQHTSRITEYNTIFLYFLSPRHWCILATRIILLRYCVPPSTGSCDNPRPRRPRLDPRPRRLTTFVCLFHGTVHTYMSAHAVCGTSIAQNSQTRLTTQTNFPLPWCFGFAGHMGLEGRCSGRSNSKNDTSLTGSRRTVFLGASHHSLFSPVWLLRYESTRALGLNVSEELLDSSSNGTGC